VPVPSEHETSGILGLDLNRPCREIYTCLARYLATLYEKRQRWIFYVPVPSEHETSGVLGPDLNRPSHIFQDLKYKVH